MKQDAITAIAMFCVGTVCGAILTAMILADRTVEECFLKLKGQWE